MRHFLKSLGDKLASALEKSLKAIPTTRKRLEQQYDQMTSELEPLLKPYRQSYSTHQQLPPQGHTHADILAEMKAMHAHEVERWQDGFVSGGVYHGQAGHIDFLNEVYALNSQSNPLHADLFPSNIKFEAEIVAMTAQMLGASQTASGSALGLDDEICGTISSGGTESILLAMKTYRDWGRAQKGITKPEIVMPVTAHAAFDKAAQYFKLKLVKVPVNAYYRADVAAMSKAITKNTVALVGSAPAFPHGIIDPIEQISELAWQHKIGCHTDACLGGFILPWAEKLGYNVPPFDFCLRGVTSISVDTHKYGYAAKGTSVVLYRGAALRRYQYYAIADWPGGLYSSPTMAGSRPGALSAVCWAAMLSLGEAGYLEATQRILETATVIKQGIAQIPELTILGDPLWVIAFASDELNIYNILDFMSQRHWSLNGLHHPSAVHLAVTLPHTQPGVADRFLSDLQAAVVHVKANPNETGEMAPVYGMAATMPLKGVVTDILKRYIDTLYKI